MHVCMLSCFSCVQLFATLWTVACQAPLSTGFSRQECWSGLPCPPPRDFPVPGFEPMSLMSPALASRFFITSATWGAPELLMDSQDYDCRKSVELSWVQFSRSVVSNPLWPHGLKHTRPPCPSPTPGVYSNSCPFSWWCHPTISSSVIPFSTCLQSFPASGSFPMSQFFASGGQSLGASTSASVLSIDTVYR